MANNNIGIAHNQYMFVKEEATIGTFNMPAGTDLIGISGESYVRQEGPTKHENIEFRGTRTKPPSIKGVHEAGEVKIMAQIKIDAAGSAPNIGPLLKGILGVETVTPATSVVYSPEPVNNDPVTFSIIYQEDNIVNFASGCKIENMTAGFQATSADDSVAMADFTGRCIKVARVIETTIDNLAGYLAGATDLVLKKNGAEIGSYIKIGTEDNGGAGYLVTARDEATKTITISPALAGPVSDGDIVAGFVPTPVFSTLKVAHWAYGEYKENDVQVCIESGELRIAAESDFHNEMCLSQYPTDISTSVRRDVEIDVNMIVRADKVIEKFEAAKTVGTLDIKLTLFDPTETNKIVFHLPYVEFNTPQTSGDGYRSAATTGMAKGSTGEDEITITCT